MMRLSLFAIAGVTALIAGCIASPAPSDLPSIQAEIQTTYSGQWTSVGAGAKTVMVNFRSTAEAAGRQVVARYGSLVDVTVGLLPLPAPAGLPHGCPWRWAPGDAGPLIATIQMPNHIGHGQFKAQIRVVNTGATPVDFGSDQPILIQLYKPGGADPIATYDGVIAGTGLGQTIAPGGSIVIDALGSTASCDISLGYDLPDGDYVARGVVDNGTGSPVPAFLTAPFDLRVGGP
jgi:hypothetical protein